MCVRLASSHFGHCPQAARADVGFARTPILSEGDLANVGLPTALGFVKGMGNIVPKLGRFAADITLGHDEPFPFQRVTQYKRNDADRHIGTMRTSASSRSNFVSYHKRRICANEGTL